MSMREVIGYALLALLIGIALWGYRRWRRLVHDDRMMRWGTTDSPRRARRRMQN